MADELFFQDCVLSWIGVEQMMVNLDIIVFLIEGSPVSGLSLWFKVVWFNMAQQTVRWLLRLSSVGPYRAGPRLYVLHKLCHKQNVFHLYFIFVKHNIVIKTKSLKNISTMLWWNSANIIFIYFKGIITNHFFNLTIYS